MRDMDDVGAGGGDSRGGHSRACLWCGKGCVLCIATIRTGILCGGFYFAAVSSCIIRIDTLCRAIHLVERLLSTQMRMLV